jgi:hypothetical protein
MIWKKKGMLFNLYDSDKTNGILEFAQSPQTLVFDDFVRIYFSTREKDSKGIYLSKIAFIDTNIELTKIINSSKKEVIGLDKSF